MTLIQATTVLRSESITEVCRMGEVEVLALRGVDFARYQSELVVLLGPSMGESVHRPWESENASVVRRSLPGGDP